ncbi:MAG TPA: hypothetical protein VIT67_06480 [Povalibacter sp.]
MASTKHPSVTCSRRARTQPFLGSARACAAVAVLLLAAIPCLAASKADPPPGTELTGYWRLNTALSDDPEQLLQKRLEEARKERERWMRRSGRADPLGIPPPGEPLPGAEVAPPPPPQNRPQQRPRNRRLEELRRMLDISDTLTIKQSGARVEIVSEVNANSFDAGTKSQISLPQGELADQRVGWEGPWFVVERRASRGPTMSYRFRPLKKTDQIESILSWGGDSPLEGIKVHRIYDRMLTPPPPPDPDRGPVR